MIPGSPSPLFYKKTDYTINNSLRFRSSSSAYLGRTPAVASNRKTWTWSAWVKRSGLGVTQGLFRSDGISTDQIYFLNTDKISIQQNDTTVRTTTAVYRDPSAWYHIVVAMDTTQATASNRTKLYVNGVEVTAFDTNTDNAQNTDGNFNNTLAHKLGSGNGSIYFDGYIAEVNFIDGQALTPASFAKADGTTNVWTPVKYTGTYGSNGFYLNFSDATSTSTISKDYSGNGNNWTSTNISVTPGSTFDQMIDVPTNSLNAGNNRGNYPVLSPLFPTPVGTISNGGLEYTRGSTAAHGSVAATFALPKTGKWYWEVTACSSVNAEVIGVANVQNNPQLPASGTELGGRTGDYMYRSNGASVSGGTTVAYGASYTNGDVVSVLWDSDGGNIEFYKNGTTQGVAYTGITQSLGKYFPAVSSAETSLTDKFNFGQRSFAYTVPAGYKALNSCNLPASLITNGAKYMMANTYTGTAATQSVVNGNFLPDIVWVKNRNITQVARLADTLRGVNVLLDVSTTTAPAEATVANSITSFDATGFTLGSNTFVNNSANGYVAWTFSIGSNTSTLDSTGGITSNVSVGRTQAISMFTYTGSGANTTAAHRLGIAPSLIIIKQRNGNQSIPVWHTAIGANQALLLGGTAAAGAADTYYNNTLPTAANVSLGTAVQTNGAAGRIYIAYCFAEVPGFSAFGSYIGNASGDGPFVYVGFRPRLVIVKATSATGSWCYFDTARDPFNAVQSLLLQSSAAENRTQGRIDIYANGFKIRETSTNDNGSGVTYAYIAFAENPFNYSRAR